MAVGRIYEDIACHLRWTEFSRACHNFAIPRTAHPTPLNSAPPNLRPPTSSLTTLRSKWKRAQGGVFSIFTTPGEGCFFGGFWSREGLGPPTTNSSKTRLMDMESGTVSAAFACSTSRRGSAMIMKAGLHVGKFRQYPAYCTDVVSARQNRNQFRRRRRQNRNV